MHPIVGRYIRVNINQNNKIVVVCCRKEQCVAVNIVFFIYISKSFNQLQLAINFLKARLMGEVVVLLETRADQGVYSHLMLICYRF